MKLSYLSKLKKIVRVSHVRNYRGSYLTSYQQKISTEQKRIKPVIHNSHESVSIVAQLAMGENHNILNKNPNVVSTENIEKYDSDLIEASRLYMSSNLEIRKLLFYGSENEEIISTNFSCHGCGSNLNCKSTSSPGFIPFEVYEEHQHNEEFMKNLLCVRCFCLSNNINPLDVSLDKDIYYDIIGKQLNHYGKGIIILVADMSDLPFSIPHHLDMDMLKNYRIILVGNKIDLLSHASKNLMYYKNYLLDAAVERGIPKDNVLFVHLLSAKSCELLEEFIDRIFVKEFIKNEPIFMLGSTNSGKSSIFNKLLKSDLCKTIVKDHVKHALISNLPGTTLNLLRFPITNSTLTLRQRRQKVKWIKSKEESKEKYCVMESNKLVSPPNQKQSFDQLVTYSHDRDQILSNRFDEQEMHKEFSWRHQFDESKITTNKWFYDTPGLINPDQLINYLPKDDVDNLYANEDLNIPKIYVLKPGLSIIMQNLARLDILESPKHIYICVHARLPIEIVNTDDIDRYYRENDHFTLYSFKSILSPPLLNRIRTTVPDFVPGEGLLPSLVPIDMDIVTNGFNEVSADVILSSIGWVGISGVENGTCKIRAWTPAAIGCDKRTPSLIPSAVRRRIYRKSHSREFSVS